MARAVLEPGKAQIERGARAHHPGDRELGLRTLEAVVEPRHRVERPIDVLSIEHAQLQRRGAGRARNVFDAALCAARAIAAALGEGNRVLVLLLLEARAQVPAAEDPAV